MIVKQIQKGTIKANLDYLDRMNLKAGDRDTHIRKGWLEPYNGNVENEHAKARVMKYMQQQKDPTDFTCFVLSFQESGVDERFTKESIDYILASFLENVYAGIDPKARPPYYSTIHRDKGRLEINLTLPNYLGREDKNGKVTYRNFKSYVHKAPFKTMGMVRSDAKRFRAWQEMINHEFGFTSPSEAASRILIKDAPKNLPAVVREQHKKLGEKLVTFLREALEGGYETIDEETLYINLNAIDPKVSGVKIGSGFAAIHYEGFEKAIRYKGGIFHGKDTEEPIKRDTHDKQSGVSSNTQQSSREYGTTGRDSTTNGLNPVKGYGGSIDFHRLNDNFAREHGGREEAFEPNERVDNHTIARNDREYRKMQQEYRKEFRSFTKFTEKAFKCYYSDAVAVPYLTDFTDTDRDNIRIQCLDYLQGKPDKPRLDKMGTADPAHLQGDSTTTTPTALKLYKATKHGKVKSKAAIAESILIAAERGKARGEYIVENLKRDIEEGVVVPTENNLKLDAVVIQPVSPTVARTIQVTQGSRIQRSEIQLLFLGMQSPNKTLNEIINNKLEVIEDGNSRLSERYNRELFTRSEDQERLRDHSTQGEFVKTQKHHKRDPNQKIAIDAGFGEDQYGVRDYLRDGGWRFEIVKRDARQDDRHVYIHEEALHIPKPTVTEDDKITRQINKAIEYCERTVLLTLARVRERSERLRDGYTNVFNRSITKLTEQLNEWESIQERRRQQHIKREQDSTRRVNPDDLRMPSDFGGFGGSR